MLLIKEELTNVSNDAYLLHGSWDILYLSSDVAWYTIFYTVREIDNF